MQSLPASATSHHGGKSSRNAAPVRRFIAVGALRFARSTIASLVKLAVGRQPHFTAHDVLFRQYVAHRLGFDTLREITAVHSPHEGAGSQALMTMNAIRFARAHGLTYIHTPFSRIHHADRLDREWAAAWEEFFNLGDGEARAARSPVNYAFTCAELWALFGVTPYQPFDEELRRDFRRKYRANKAPRRAAGFNVCIHVRRRNPHDFHDEDVTDMSRLIPVVARLRTLMSERQVPCTLKVFSQGPWPDAAALGVSESELFVDADPIWTLRELIDADLLVTTKGTFSYVAGLLCAGAVIADPLQFPPQPDWVPYDAAGVFDAVSLRRRLDAAAAASPG